MIITYDGGNMIVTHPSGVIDVYDVTELNEIIDKLEHRRKEQTIKINLLKNIIELAVVSVTI